MKKLKLLSVSTVLIVFLGVITISCVNGNKTDPPGVIKVKYFISEYYTVADVSVASNESRTMWGITLNPKKRVTISNSPDLYKSLAKEHGENGTKEYLTSRTYAVPYDITKVSVFSGDNDVSKDFDISFKSVKNVVEDEKGQPNDFRAQLNLATNNEFMWLVDCIFFVNQRGDTRYSNLVAIIALTNGEKVECKLL